MGEEILGLGPTLLPTDIAQGHILVVPSATEVSHRNDSPETIVLQVEHQESQEMNLAL